MGLLKKIKLEVNVQAKQIKLKMFSAGVKILIKKNWEKITAVQYFSKIILQKKKGLPPPP